MHLLAEKVYISHTTLVIEGENYLSLIDPGLDISGRKQNSGSSVSGVFALSERLDKPVQNLIVTHSHIDHIFNTRAYIKEFPDLVCMGHADSPYLNKLMKNGTSVFMVASHMKRTIDGIGYFFMPTPGHSKAGDDLSVYVPSLRIVHVGDLFQPQGHSYEKADSISPIPYFNEGNKYLESLDMLMNLDFDLLITGHGDVLDRVSGKRGLELTKQVIQRIKELAINLTMDNPQLEEEVICEWIFDTIVFERNFDKSQAEWRKGEGSRRGTHYRRFDLPGIQDFVKLAKDFQSPEIFRMNKNETTDNLDELLDVVDEFDQVIGSATRRECNRNPNLIHRAAYVLIFNSEGRLFLHRRSQTKDTCPGMWSISVAGHVGQGETYEKTIIREMEEEIGTVLEVEFLDKFLLRHVTENEYSAIFRGYSDGPFRLNPKEIDEGDFFNMDTIKSKMWKNLTPFSQMVLDSLADKDLL